MTRLTDVNLSILADTDCPSDWEREDLLGFAQEAAREILKLHEHIGELESKIFNLRACVKDAHELDDNSACRHCGKVWKL